VTFSHFGSEKFGTSSENPKNSGLDETMIKCNFEINDGDSVLINEFPFKN